MLPIADLFKCGQEEQHTECLRAHTVKSLLAVFLLMSVGCVYTSTFDGADLDGTLIWLDKANVMADGQDQATVTLSVRRGDGTPLPNITVVLAADRCHVTQPDSVTDAQGKVTGKVSSAAFGLRQLTAAIRFNDFSGALKTSTVINFYSPPGGAADTIAAKGAIVAVGDELNVSIVPMVRQLMALSTDLVCVSAPRNASPRRASLSST